MDANSILAKTAKGIVQAKSGNGDLSYDAVRLLRLVNGKASIAELRAKFEDLTDARFQKAVTALEQKDFIKILSVHEADTAEFAELRELDETVQDLTQEVVQSLDFTKLEYRLLDAVRASLPEVEAATTGQNGPQAATAHAHAEPEANLRASQGAAPDLKAALKAKLAAELRPKVEAGLREELVAALRPRIEEELRRELIAALRPALETEIRAKLTTALSSEAIAAAGPSSHLRLLECIRETVFQVDLTGKSVYVNSRWAKLSGYGREETLGKPFVSFFVPQDRRGLADYLIGVARGAATPVIVEARLARKSGTPLRVVLRAAPLTAESGATIGICGTLRGVSPAQERAAKP